MSFADERTAIEGRMAANWTTTPIRWENVPFAETAASHVALFIIDGEGQQISLGDNPIHQWSGLISIKILVPENTGNMAARTYADTIATIYRRQAFAAGANGRIVCATPSIQVIGSNRGWYQINVLTPYRRSKVF